MAGGQPWFGKGRGFDPLCRLCRTRKNLAGKRKAQLDDDDLDEIASRVKARFSAGKFPACLVLSRKGQRKPLPASPLLAASLLRRGKTVRSAADLDSRARQVGESMVRMGIYKDLNEYAKELHA